jgi:Zc3h12a-like Ribonuclease NYN domain/S1 RNA binding domain
MAHHVVIDGSNLATEGRSLPSLKQLNEAVAAYRADNPTALITVVVDATFGHRIDASEVAQFDAAVNKNELVAPPAGAVGRGDAFVLGIANKVNATVLSNDSYQEFHGEYKWLFDEGRLIGGKPVPHIGWVFVARAPVRGPLSRKSVSDAKRKQRGKVADDTVRVGSKEASLPLPVPTAPPPGVAGGKRRDGRDQRSAKDVPPTAAIVAEAKAAPQPKGPAVNDLMTFLTFVQEHPVGTSVSAVVDHYSSHGAYVKAGDLTGYLPLRLIADPAPRSAREFVKIGETVTLVVESFVAAKRSVDLAMPSMATVKAAEPPAASPEKPGRTAKKAAKAAKKTAKTAPAKAAPAKAAPAKKAAAKAATSSSDEQRGGTSSARPAKRAAKKPAAAADASSPAAAGPAKSAAKKPATPRKTAAAKKSARAAAAKE